LSLFAQALIPLLIRCFYAFQNAITPFLLGIFSAIVNVFLSIYLSRPFIIWHYNFDLGVAGLALAFSLSSILNLILLWLVLRVKTSNLDEKNIGWSVIKVTLATLAMAAVMQFMKYGIEPYFGTQTFIGIFLQGFISGVVGIAVFIVASLALKSQEMITFTNALRRRIFKEEKYFPQESMDESVDVK